MKRSEGLHLGWFFVCFFALTSCVEAEEPQVRVAIAQEVPAVRVTVLAPCRLTDFLTGKLIGEWPNLKWQEVKAGNPGLKIGSLQTESQALLLETKKDSILRVDARSYKGKLIFTRTPAGRLTVINRLGLEEYLVGALASEANPDWPLEALKAHAVVSRTMVAHRIWVQQGQKRPFDITADTGTHLYYGVGAERDWVRRAVRETAGQVLSSDGELFSATFHANCGGHTEDASELWAVKGDSTPLKGRPDPYCKDRRHYRWRMNLSTKEFMAAVGSEAKEIGELRGGEVVEWNSSGRARSVRLVGTKGALTLTGRKLRERLGANRLRSLKFTMAVSPRTVSFSGFGWGHGVGFCQWGAYGMARQGKTMDEILTFYFSGARRRNLKGLPGFVSND